MINISVITCMHGRAHVSRVFAEAMLRLKEKNKDAINLNICVAVSDIESENVCKNYGFNYVVTDNKPLGAKWNRAAELAGTFDNDYVVIFGDDDIPSDDFFNSHVMDAIHRNEPHFGFNQIYFADVQNEKGCIFKYDHLKLVGCGRFISIEAFQRLAINTRFRWAQNYLIGDVPGVCISQTVEWLDMESAIYFRNERLGFIHGEPTFRIWEDHLNKSLDRCIEMRLVRLGYLPKVIDTGLPVITDLKSGVNIWQYDHISPLSVAVPYDQALSSLSEKEKQIVRSWKTN